jgi:DNA polymerase III subunit epsilon
VSTHRDSWRDAALVGLDLEGSGAQDRDAEVILEIATVPIVAGQPAVGDAYCTLVNPGRTVAARPWISPGLTNAALADAPDLATVDAQLAARINGWVLVGHNVSVDWRLLHRRCPTLAPSGLLDTWKLARHVQAGGSMALGALVDHQGLTDAVTGYAVGSQPHRALWDTVAAALLLAALVDQLGRPDPSIGELLMIAGVPLEPARPAAETPALFDL